MKYLKMLGLAAFAAMAFTAFVGAGSASATTLAITGVGKNEPVEVTASLKSGTSAELSDTAGFSVNKCTGSHVNGVTENPYTNTTRVTGKIAVLEFSGCDHDVTVHKPGALAVEWTAETNGRVYSESAEVTVWSTIHSTYITCTTTAGGTLIGTLTGVKHGNATMDINAILNCGSGHLTSARWKGTYTVTTANLGVEA